MQNNIRESLFRPELLKRIVIYGLLTLLLGSAQCSFFPLLNIVPSTPDLIMGMLLGIILIDSDKSAAVVAVAAGFFLDAIGGGAIALSPLVYCLFVLFISLFSRKMLTSFASFALLMIPALLYRGLATAVCMAIDRRALVPIAELFSVIGPELLCTAIICLPLYFAVKLCAIPLETHSKFTF
jgi:cell shape-determining protein MreD